MKFTYKISKKKKRINKRKIFQWLYCRCGMCFSCPYKVVYEKWRRPVSQSCDSCIAWRIEMKSNCNAWQSHFPKPKMGKTYFFTDFSVEGKKIFLMKDVYRYTEIYLCISEQSWEWWPNASLKGFVLKTNH